MTTPIENCGRGQSFSKVAPTGESLALFTLTMI